jgi:hypothetical protein
MKVFRTLAVALAGTIVAAIVAAGQTWEPLNNQPGFNPGTMLLLTDGTVFVHSEPNCLTCTGTDYSSWYKLTPDSVSVPNADYRLLPPSLIDDLEGLAENLDNAAKGISSRVGDGLERM